MMLPFALSSLLVVLAAEPASAAPSARESPRVLVVTYQALGLEPARVDELTAAAAGAFPSVAPPGESKLLRRSAAMCGEDGPCLSTLSARAQATHVLALGFGALGKDVLVSALLIDGKGVRLREATRRVEARLLDAALVRELVAPLVAALPQPAPAVVEPVNPAPTPPEPLKTDVPRELKLELPSSVVRAEPVAPPSRPLRPWAIGTTVATALALAAAVGVGLAAQNHHQTLPDLPPAERASADADQRTLNAVADVSAGVAGALGITSLVLWILDLNAEGQR